MATKSNAVIIESDNGSGNETIRPVIPNVDSNSDTNGNSNDIIHGYETDSFPTTGTDTGTDTGTRRRGRPRGSANRNTSSTTKVPKNLEGIESLLLSVHAMGAMILSTPELALEQSEAKSLANAISQVSSFYSYGIISPKTMAWINLAMVTGGLYGTRIVAIRNRVKEESKQKKQTPKPFEVKKDTVNGAVSKPNTRTILTPSDLGFSGVQEGVTFD